MNEIPDSDFPKNGLAMDMSPRTVIEKITYAEELLKIAKEREERLLATSSVAESQADDERMHYDNALADTKRFIERLERDIARLREKSELLSRVSVRPSARRRSLVTPLERMDTLVRLHT